MSDHSPSQCLTWILVLSLIAIISIHQVDSSCPVECRCFDHKVVCYNQDLNTPPTNLDNATQYLVLSGNSIQVLPPRLFVNMSDLKQLYLSFNRISTVAEAAFDGLSELSRLYLNSNRLQSVPGKALLGCRNLQLLDLSSNPIQTIRSTDFLSFRTFELFDRNLHQVIEWRSKLQWLSLSSAEISDIDNDAFDGLTELSSLRLKANRLSSFRTNTLVGTANLETLDLTMNRIRKLDSLGFRMFYDNRLSKLRNLYLYYNEISFISDDAFNGLGGLYHLVLHGNFLSEVPATTFFGCRKLAILSLRKNRIQTLRSNDFIAFKTGKSIDHQNTSYENLSYLMELDLSGNRISVIEDNVFERLSRLDTLHLDNNFLKSIPSNGYSNCCNLKILNLQHNRIMSIKALQFEMFCKLEYLHIGNNLIEKIEDDAFFGLEKLNELSLENNRIFNISSKVVKDLPQSDNFRIFLHSNPLNCDCSLIVAWKLAYKNRYFPSATCIRQEQGFKSMRWKSINVKEACEPVMYLNVSKRRAVYAGEDITFHCWLANNSISTKLSWLIENQFGEGFILSEPLEQHFKYIVKKTIYKERLELILKITNLTVDDSSRVTCLAQNDVGEISKSFNLFVNEDVNEVEIVTLSTSSKTVSPESLMRKDIRSKKLQSTTATFSQNDQNPDDFFWIAWWSWLK